MKDRCRITLVQFTLKDDVDAVVDAMPMFFEQASAFGSDLIVFPEYCLGHRVTLDDPRVRRFFELAKQHHMYAIGGLIEQMGERWATTALVIDREGNLLGRYLKTHPAAGVGKWCWPPIEGHDAEARGLLGDRFKVWPLDFGTIGVLQCYDGLFPEAWGCTSFMGAEIILWINGRSSDVDDPICIAMAQSYGVVVGGNVTDGCNTGFAQPRYGTHVIADGEPDPARLFPRIAEKGDACVSAEIDLRELRECRKHHRQMHQRRPELYSLLTQDAKVWQDYPDIPWTHPECEQFVNRSQLGLGSA